MNPYEAKQTQKQRSCIAASFPLLFATNDNCRYVVKVVVLKHQNWHNIHQIFIVQKIMPHYFFSPPPKQYQFILVKKSTQILTIFTSCACAKACDCSRRANWTKPTMGYDSLGCVSEICCGRRVTC